MAKKRKMIVVSDNGTVRNIKPNHLVFGSFMASKEDSIMKAYFKGKALVFSFESNEWDMIKKEIGFKGDSIDVCLDVVGNRLASLKLDIEVVDDSFEDKLIFGGGRYYDIKNDLGDNAYERSDTNTDELKGKMKAKLLIDENHSDVRWRFEDGVWRWTNYTAEELKELSKPLLSDKDLLHE